MMNRTATAKRRNLCITIEYGAVIGDGKVRYMLTCSHATHHFTAPPPDTIRTLAEQWGLENFTEIKRHVKRIGIGQILTIECAFLAGSTRDQRAQFVTALLNKI